MIEYDPIKTARLGILAAFVAGSVFIGCAKDEEIVLQGDTTQTITRTEVQQDTSLRTPASSGADTSTPAGRPRKPQIVQLDPSDPASIPPFPIKPHKEPDSKVPFDPKTAPIGTLPLIPSEKLVPIHPKVPGYVIESRMTNRDYPNISKSIALLRNVKDTSRTIRSTIFDMDERASSTFVMQFAALRQQGSITQYPEGEPVTAYFLQINGAIGSKAYNPTTKVAVLTLLLSDHSIIQLREDKCESADNLVEAARYIDVKKFEAIKRY